MQLINSKQVKIIRKITLGLALAVCIGGLASLAALASAKTQDVEADLVFHNGFVYTVDGVRSRAQAFATKDGKFIAVGSNDDM
jgi:hypothetical protein